MPVTALGASVAPPADATHTAVVEHYTRRFEEHGRYRPTALCPAHILSGGSMSGMVDASQKEVLAMVTKQSLSVSDTEGNVEHYMRLSEIDSIVVQGAQVLLRGCPQLAQGEDVLLSLEGQEQLLEGFVSAMRCGKQQAFRLPLPVLHTDAAVGAAAVFAAPTPVDAPLWELPRREEKHIDVRPESPKQSKALLSLHTLRRDLSSVEGEGLRGGIEGPVSLRRAVSPPSPPRQVSLCSIDTSLEPYFAPLNPIFVRVVMQVCSRTDERIAERVVAVCRDTLLLCDKQATVHRMLRYPQICVVQLMQRADCSREDVMIIRAYESEDEAPIVLALTDDKRNIHRGGYSLMNAVERAAIDAKCSVHFIRGGDHNATLSVISDHDNASMRSASSEGVSEEYVLSVGAAGLVPGVSDVDLLAFAEELGEAGSERAVRVARALLHAVAEQGQGQAVQEAEEDVPAVAETPPEVQAELELLRRKNTALLDEVLELKHERDDMACRLSESNARAFDATLQDCVACEGKRCEVEALNNQLYDARTQLSAERHEVERLSDCLRELGTKQHTSRILPTAANTLGETDTPPATPPQRPLFAASPVVNPRELDPPVPPAPAPSMQSSSACASSCMPSADSPSLVPMQRSLSLVRVDTIMSRLSDIRPASPTTDGGSEDAPPPPPPPAPPGAPQEQRRSPPRARLKLNTTFHPSSPLQSSPDGGVTVRSNRGSNNPYTPSPRRRSPSPEAEAEALEAAAAASTQEKPPLPSEGEGLGALSFRALSSAGIATPDVTPKKSEAACNEAGSCGKALGDSIAAPQGGDAGRESLQAMLRRSRERRAARAQSEVDAAQSQSLQSILERSRRRASKQSLPEEVEEDTAPPQASSSPKGFSATPPPAAREERRGGEPCDDVAGLRSALQDYVCTVDLSPDSATSDCDGGSDPQSPPAPPPHHAPIMMQEAEEADPFSTELAEIGLTAEEQTLLKALGVRASRHLEYVTLSELHDGLSVEVTARLLRHFSLEAPSCPDHFVARIE